MIKVIVLGTAQDGGVPHLGCRAPYCARARRDLAFARRVACLAIIDTEARRSYLIDATPDVRGQLDALAAHPDMPARSDRNPVDALILTHAHIGHYTGLVQFGKEVLATHGLPVYCTVAMSDFLIHNGPWAQLVRDGHITLRVFDEQAELFLTDNLTVRPFRVPHRQEWSDTLGIEIEGPSQKLIYITDIDRWSDWVRDVHEAVSGCDIALLDGTFFSGDELPGRDMSTVPHPLISETMERLADLTASRHIAFTHLNHTNPVQDADSAQRHDLEALGFHVVDELQEFVL
ncbi:MAG: MBL fold metallo-hydrolase [Chloroflexi bacterium]|nr:MBL fold metallo-hydrolase [Chloroflexota bacterium]